MKIACFIPIKARSERVAQKNFRIVGSKPLFQYIIDKAIASNSFDDVFVDTDSPVVAEYAKAQGAKHIPRLPELAANNANGNDLLNYHASLTDHELLFQLFATAPMLRVETIRKAVDFLSTTAQHDSITTVNLLRGMYWYKGHPVTYIPNLLPRSQDLEPLIEETTALYGITRASNLKYRCRIGATPYFLEVSKEEAIDLNTEEDFILLDRILLKQTK